MANELTVELQYRRFSAAQEARAAKWLPRLRSALNPSIRVIEGEFRRVVEAELSDGRMETNRWSPGR